MIEKLSLWPGSIAAIERGCDCGEQPKDGSINFHIDCPVHREGIRQHLIWQNSVDEALEGMGLR